MNGQVRILTGARIFTGHEFLEGHSLVIRNGHIESILPEGATLPEGERVLLPPDQLIAPGFIDAQVNGAGGILFNETPTSHAVRDIGNALRRFGVTGYLPTFITDRREGMVAACAAALTAAEPAGSMILGVHLEGPFIGPSRPGVHNPAFIRKPDENDFDLLENTARDFGPDARLLLTLAPETVSETEITRLAQAGVIVSLGHTGSTFEQAKKGVAAGARGFTHLFNAMPPVANREPGPVGAALDSAEAFCGIIADGIHVHPVLLRAVLATKVPGTVFLVSDAMPPVGTDQKSFILYGKEIYRRDGRLVTADGVLAGADIDMLAAVRNCVTLLGLDLAEALRMAALYPARFLKLDHRTGSIAPSLRADLVLLSCWQEPQKLKVEATWVAGNMSS